MLDNWNLLPPFQVYRKTTLRTPAVMTWYLLTNMGSYLFSSASLPLETAQEALNNYLKRDAIKSRGVALRSSLNAHASQRKKVSGFMRSVRKLGEQRRSFAWA